MSFPPIVESSLDDEQVAAQVDFGDEDLLLVTPSRTLVYRGDGLLRDESVEEFPHDAERVEVNESRRKTEIALDYGLDGTRSFSVPGNRLNDTLHPVLAGVLNAAGVTDPGETVKQTYRFSELTVVVTSHRLIKHIGEAVWDDEYRQLHYDDVTGLDFEEGSVATQVVLQTAGRPERIKAPNDQARDLRERLEDALFSYHDVRSSAELAEKSKEEAEDEDSDDADEPDDEESGENGGSVAFEDGVEAIDAGTPESSETAAASEAAAAEQAEQPSQPESEMSAADVLDAELRGSEDSESEAEEIPPAVAERLDDLTEAVERQHDAIEEQRVTIEQLIDELNRGR